MKTTALLLAIGVLSISFQAVHQQGIASFSSPKDVEVEENPSQPLPYPSPLPIIQEPPVTLINNETTTKSDCECTNCCPVPVVSLRLDYQSKYYDSISETDIKTVSQIPLNVHWRDTHFRLEGTDDVLVLPQFKTAQFSLSIHFAILQDFTSDLELMELPLGSIKLEVTRPNHAKIAYVKAESKIYLSDEVELRHNNKETWQWLVVSHIGEEVTTFLKNIGYSTNQQLKIDEEPRDSIVLKGSVVTTGFYGLVFYNEYMGTKLIENCTKFVEIPERVCPAAMMSCPLNSASFEQCEGGELTMTENKPESVYKKETMVYVEDGASLTIQHPVMESVKFTFEVTARVLEIQQEAPLMTLPTGQLLTIDQNGALKIGEDVVSTCKKSIDVSKSFRLVVSINRDGGKMTLRMCQGESVKETCEAKQIQLSNNTDTNTLILESQKSSQFSKLEFYKDFYHTPQLVGECLMGCTRKGHECPKFEKQWSLKRVSAGQGEESNFFEGSEGREELPVNTPEETVFQREESITIEGGKSKFTVSKSDRFTIMISHRSTQTDLQNGEYMIAELPVGQLIMKVTDKNSGFYAVNIDNQQIQSSQLISNFSYWTPIEIGYNEQELTMEVVDLVQSFALVGQAQVQDSVTFSGVDVYSEFANFTYFDTFMTAFELKCYDIKVLPEARECLPQEEIIKYALNEENMLNETDPGVTWDQCSVQIETELEIQNDNFKGNDYQY